MDHITFQTRTPRERWIAAGLDALAAGGPDAVRVEVLAKSLGVTKGGFYGFFADREAPLEAMLDTWEKESTDSALERVERQGGDPEKIARAGLLTFSEHLLPIDLAVRDWARRDEAVAERLRRVDNRRMGLLREMIGTFCTHPDEVEARSVLDFAAGNGLADRSLREIAAGVGTSHRMLLFHFQSREGLLAAVVGAMEARQRAMMTLLAETAATPAN